MRNRALRFHLSRDLPFVGVKMHIVSESGQNGHEFAVAAPLTFQDVEPGMQVREPALHLGDDEAQALMDELWRVGLRPSEGSGSAGAMAATQHHLADMREQNTKLLDAVLAGR